MICEKSVCYKNVVFNVAGFFSICCLSAMEFALKNGIQFQLIKVGNNSYIARLEKSASSDNGTLSDPYDPTGALYYVVAVVFLYGFSIVLMIGSLVKRSKSDHGVSKYMKEMDTVRRLERRQEKFKVRLAMNQSHQRGAKPPDGKRDSMKLKTKSKTAPAGIGFNDHNGKDNVYLSSWSLVSDQGSQQQYPLLMAASSGSEPPSPLTPRIPQIRVLDSLGDSSDRFSFDDLDLESGGSLNKEWIDSSQLYEHRVSTSSVSTCGPLDTLHEEDEETL